MEASRPSLGVRATGLVKQLFLWKRLKRLSTFEPLYGLHVVGLRSLGSAWSAPTPRICLGVALLV